MDNKAEVKFSNIAIAINVAEYPVRATVEIVNRFASAEQDRRKLVTIGHMHRDGLMMRFVPADRIWVGDLGWTTNPLDLFRGHRVSPTMKGCKDFCGAMMAHLKIMGG